MNLDKQTNKKITKNIIILYVPLKKDFFMNLIEDVLYEKYVYVHLIKVKFGDFKCFLNIST